MNARERYVAGQPPSWSRPSQAFRHFDGRNADWRSVTSRSRMPKSRPRRPVVERVRRFAATLRSAWSFENILLGPSCDKRDITIFVVGCAWGVMCAIGAMAAWGIHP